MERDQIKRGESKRKEYKAAVTQDENLSMF